MALEFGGTPEDAPGLVTLWAQAGPPASHLLRAAARVPTPGEVADEMLAGRESYRKRHKAHADSRQHALRHSLNVGSPAVVPPGVDGKWPTKLRRSLALAGNANAREVAEHRERERWVRELGAL